MMNIIRIRIGGGNISRERPWGDLTHPLMHIFDPFATHGEQSWRPHIDICEDVGGFIVLVELAGVEIGHIDLEICGGLLKLSGQRNRRSLPAGARYHLAEISYGFFERIFSLPEDVDTDNVDAAYREGILEICLKKTAGNRSGQSFSRRQL